MANNDPYGGGYQGYAGQSYAGYGSDIVPPPATPNPRDAADCAFKRPKYPGWLCPLHVDIVLQWVKAGGSSGIDAFGCLRSLRARSALDGG